ncbi:LuxR C-terminal-related transcriptional regulator [Paenibacillus barengoltzii]|uniref:LuxR C-terminal-related transcriptional regulator n=1 Tax=Paenibacillus timonensis TaxID=225915 RepID=A0ABW3SA57_9BACL|nr:response regulator transcription factor [Paenibacillus timonensis]MCH1638872.1 response regulator transcription factor [Paenibacillus timonensis]
MNKIKVLLVEDDPVWNEYISETVNREPDLFLVGTAQTKVNAIRIVSMLDIHVVLLDVVLGGKKKDGLDAALEIVCMSKAKVIMLTVLDQAEIISEAFGNGAFNYIVKTAFEDIPEAVRAAYSGLSSIHASTAGMLRSEFVRMKQLEMRQALTRTEVEILRFIHNGHTRSSIGEQLHITESTVKKHVNRVIRKLKVHSGREAARKANLKGIL